MNIAASRHLAVLLEDARRLAHEREARIVATPEHILKRVLGVTSLASCQDMARSPRLAWRLDALLKAATVADAEDRARAAKLAEQRAHAAPAPQPALHTPVPAVAQPVPPATLSPEDVDTLIGRVAAAIMLSHAGALLSRRDIEAATARFGGAAVEFALGGRSLVPYWMRAGAGERDDVLLQFAATCLLCLAEDGEHVALDPVMEQVRPFDPLPVHLQGERQKAAALASAALDFSPEPEAERDDVIVE